MPSGLVRPSIVPLQVALPWGIPRRSLIVLAGPAGTGKTVLAAHLSKFFMESGEKVIYVTFDDDPKSLVEHFRSFRWDIDTLFGKGLFSIVDGFSFRLGDLSADIGDEYVVRRVTPSDKDGIIYGLYDIAAKRYSMQGEGLIVVDSLNELMFSMDISQVLEFVKTIRAVFAKGLGIMVVTVLHTATELLEELAAHLEYLVDGFIETRLNPTLLEIGIPLKELMVRKMRGTMTNPQWVPYVIVDEGIMGVDQSKLMALIQERMKEAAYVTSLRGVGGVGQDKGKG